MLLPPSLIIDRTKILYVMLVTLTTILSVVVKANALEDVDPSADFSGYMKEMDRREQQEHAYESKLAAHEEWRQTTWSGFCVRQVQKVLHHLKPFLLLVLDALKNSNNNEGSSIENFIIYVGVRMGVILVFCIFGYVGGKLFQLLIGTKDGIIEVVEEIVILHEHDTEEDAAKARSQTSRSKKQKHKSQ